MEATKPRKEVNKAKSLHRLFVQREGQLLGGLALQQVLDGDIDDILQLERWTMLVSNRAQGVIVPDFKGHSESFSLSIGHGAPLCTDLHQVYGNVDMSSELSRRSWSPAWIVLGETLDAARCGQPFTAWAA